MKWEGNRESDNVDDRRGDDGGGGGGGFGLGGRSVGIGTIVLALVGSYVLGVNPMQLLNILSGGGTVQQQAPRPPVQAAVDDPMKKFVRTVLADTEDTWGALFQQHQRTYVRPKLTLFSGSIQTGGCGIGRSAMGPFYCPADQRVYLDTGFFQLMQQRFHVDGQFAEAYVIAHEVGHHVQNLMGISARVDAARRAASETQANALSVRLELQADCFAGVWAYHANQERQILEQGDVDKALNAASAIGDDALQRQAHGQVVPDSFTHGTSEQRVRWFTRGINSGKVSQCDTFKASQL